MRAAVNQVVSTARDSGPLWAGSLVLDRVLPWPVLGLWPPVSVDAERLERQLDAILRAWGMPAEHAELTAANMVETDLRGVDSHGSGMLRHYHRALLAHSITMAPAIEVAARDGSTAVIDGGGGLGHVPARHRDGAGRRDLPRDRRRRRGGAQLGPLRRRRDLRR